MHGALGSVWTIVGGLALVTLGALLWGFGEPADYGFFTYFADPDSSQISFPPGRLGHEQLAGLALLGIGLVVTAAAAGFRLGARTSPAQSPGSEGGAAV